MEATWQETAQGPALRLQIDGKHVSFLEGELENPAYVAHTAAVSLWEGVAGKMPQGILGRWQWRRGLRRLQRNIEKEVRLRRVR